MSQMTDFIAAMNHGASMIYHDVLALETDAAKWEKDHPVYNFIIQKGIAYGNSMLAAYGIPMLAIENAAEVSGNAIMGALKLMAAQDGTVQSLPSVSTTTTTTVATPVTTPLAGTPAQLPGPVTHHS